MSRLIALAAFCLLAIGCFEESVVPDATPRARAKATVTYSKDADDADWSSEPEPPRTVMRGELVVPIDTPRARALAHLGALEAECSKALYVEECGEKGEDGKPTGKYANGSCSVCDDLFKARKSARAAGYLD